MQGEMVVAVASPSSAAPAPSAGRLHPTYKEVSFLFPCSIVAAPRFPPRFVGVNTESCCCISTRWFGSDARADDHAGADGAAGPGRVEPQRHRQLHRRPLLRPPLSPRRPPLRPSPQPQVPWPASPRLWQLLRLHRHSAACSGAEAWSGAASQEPRFSPFRFDSGVSGPQARAWTPAQERPRPGGFFSFAAAGSKCSAASIWGQEGAWTPAEGRPCPCAFLLFTAAGIYCSTTSVWGQAGARTPAQECLPRCGAVGGS